MWNIIKRSRVRWIRIVISNSATQVFYRHKAESTAFSERFVGTEPTVQCFQSVLKAPSRQYCVFEAFFRRRAHSTGFSKRYVGAEPKAPKFRRPRSATKVPNAIGDSLEPWSDERVFKYSPEGPKAPLRFRTLIVIP